MELGDELDSNTLESSILDADLMDRWSRNSDNQNCKREVGECYLELYTDLLDTRVFLMAGGDNSTFWRV